MNVKDFEYLLEVATQGNISRAAEQLYISQSALTKFIQKKERELGGPLFRREGGYLVPTAMGEICIQKAREILELHDQLNEELEREKVKRMGSLRIGVSASRIRFLTQSVLPQHLEKFPDVPIMMRYKNFYELPQLLKKNEFNLIFGSYTKEEYGLDYHVIGEEEMVLAVQKGHRLEQQAQAVPGKKYPYIPNDLWMEERVIIPRSSTMTGKMVWDLFARSNRTPKGILDIQGLGNVRFAVGTGIGVAITPSIPLYPDEKITYLSIDGNIPLRKVVAVTRKEDAHNSQLKNFIRLLKAAYSIC